MSLIRWIVGKILLFLNAITLPKPMERSKEAQEKVDAQTKSMILYHFEACPFCLKVRRVMGRLNLTVEMRDTKRNKDYASELLNGGGKPKVPCLRIAKGDGSVQWMYESSDINAFLEKEFG
jgi:glutaredoxin